MSDLHSLYDGVIARRSASARHLGAPAPDAATLERIVFAASRAPDHGRLVPFRFVRVAEHQRGRLAEALVLAARQTDPALAESEIARLRDKAAEGLAPLVLIARIDAAHPKIPASDQWLAVGCALENLLLASQSLGFAAAVKSGRHFSALGTAFGLGAGEQVVAYVVFGTPSEMPPAKPKPAVADILSDWD